MIVGWVLDCFFDFGEVNVVVEFIIFCMRLG